MPDPIDASSNAMSHTLAFLRGAHKPLSISKVSTMGKKYGRQYGWGSRSR